MTDEQDDDDLGIDLDAWQAPPPPTGVADGVIARMRATLVTAAAPVEPQPAPRRWWVLGGGIAAATAVAGTLLVAFVATRPPADGHGAVVAEQPQHLSLGPSSADLDAGTAVTWRRARHRLTAEQRMGAATWRVDDDDTLAIDAMLASIETSDASLRVEVHMKSDAEREELERTKKTIATSALTAAAVALVTVIVYDGSVKVIESGKTTTVAAGTAYQIRANGPNVIEEEAVVGAAPRYDDIDEELMTGMSSRARLEALKRELEQKTLELEALKRSIEEKATRQVDPFASCDEVSCVLNNYEGPCCAKFKKYADALDRSAISRGVASIRSDIRTCGENFTGQVSASVKVAPAGTVTSVAMHPPDAAPSACIAKVFRGAKFDITRNGGSFKYPFVFSAPKDCDADELHAKGQDAFASGRYSAAFQHFDLEDRCRPSLRVKKLAFAAACRSKAVSQAKRIWRAMPQDARQQVLQFCVREGITPDELADGTGGLRIQSNPAATVLIDGVEHGTTPLAIDNLTAGKHKVTLVVGDDKYTWSVTVKAGETVSLSKSLQ